MKMFIHILVLSALAFTGVSGCQPTGKEAGNDTKESQTKAPVASVAKPVEPITEPAIAKEPQVRPGPKGPVKEAGPPKNSGGQTAQSNAAGAGLAARGDSIKQAQKVAEAIRIARLDSLKQAEAAKAGARTETIVTRGEKVLPGGTDQIAQGKAPYEENCRKCHGVLGVPPKTMKAKFPKIVTFDAAFFAKHSDDSVVTVLTKGKNEDMKSFKDKLTHGQMVAVAAYIRSLAKKD
jgi:mono/diheme cytochrome c family protein